MPTTPTSQRPQRVLPVVSWLKLGVAATGVGIALAAAPVASADDGSAPAAPAASATETTPAHSSASRAAAEQSAPRRAAAVAGPARQRPAAAAASSGPAKPAGAVSAVRAQRASATPAAASGRAERPRPLVSPDLPVRAPSAAQQTDILGDVAAFLGLPGAPATTSPTIDSVPLYLRLQLDDLFTGSTPAPVSNPATVITGLFRQMLRKDPTATELQNYTGLWNLTGINGVVASLYSSLAFRQQQVGSYYLELLGRLATPTELSWGATQLTWGVPEPLFVASLAGSNEYYAASSAGGGPNGPTPSAKSFVDLMYRTLVGRSPDPAVAPVYVQQVQAGRPTGLVALEFVNADPFREVKVLETFSVLGLSPTPEVVSDLVRNWFLLGGLSGISMSLLASGPNTFNIEAGQVTLPDMVAAAQMQQLLLAPYDDSANGFNAVFNDLFGTPTKDVNCKKTPDSCTNLALYTLLSSNGSSRGIPNDAATVKQGFFPVSKLLPSQNEISLSSSLAFPLTDPDSLRTAFNGGNVSVAGRQILTSADGQYIVDGHHRWSQLFLINPYANIGAADIGYVPNPKQALAQTQVALAAQTGWLEETTAGNDNLFTLDEASFNTQVAAIIDNGAKAGQPTKPAVFAVFTEFLDLDGQTDEQKMVSIQNYLWSNVILMRNQNFYITDAPVRDVMPQTSRSTFTPVLDLMRAPSPLSYSFPIISYLG